MIQWWEEDQKSGDGVISLGVLLDLDLARKTRRVLEQLDRVRAGRTAQGRPALLFGRDVLVFGYNCAGDHYEPLLLVVDQDMAGRFSRYRTVRGPRCTARSAGASGHESEIPAERRTPPWFARQIDNLIAALSKLEEGRGATCRYADLGDCEATVFGLLSRGEVGAGPRFEPLFVLLEPALIAGLTGLCGVNLADAGSIPELP